MFLDFLQKTTGLTRSVSIRWIREPTLIPSKHSTTNRIYSGESRFLQTIPFTNLYFLYRGEYKTIRTWYFGPTGVYIYIILYKDILNQSSLSCIFYYLSNKIFQKISLASKKVLAACYYQRFEKKI